VNFREYISKMKGSTRGTPPRVSNSEIVWSWIGAFLGMSAVAWLDHFFFEGTDLSLMVGSLGASSVLIYGAIRSPLAQPRNLVGGHFLAAIIGVSCWKIFHQYPWLAEAMAVATAIVIMHATRTLHPPAAATALIAVSGSPAIHKLGYLYVLIPATIAPLILLFVALLVNNIPASRRYPENWF
jgi:CBS-domain-containing membrane protein